MSDGKTSYRAKGKNVKKSSIPLIGNIEPAMSSEMSFDKDIFLTFAVYDSENQNLSLNNYLIGVRDFYTKNDRKNIIPVSHSINLIKKLKETEFLSDRVARESMGRTRGLSYDATIGLTNEYEELLKSGVHTLPRNKFNNEAISISREDLNYFFVPKKNPSVLEVLINDPAGFYSVLRFSPKYESQLKGGSVNGGKSIEITREDLENKDDFVVLTLGNFIGDKIEGGKRNHKRKFLIYFTPEEIIPYL